VVARVFANIFHDENEFFTSHCFTPRHRECRIMYVGLIYIDRIPNMF
jgi:hypothetical protein